MNKIFCILSTFFVTAICVGANEDFSHGQITDPVTLLSTSKESYALYLPSSYNSAGRWPILYCYDARGRGKIAADLFRSGAEKYGYIVASSNNTRSDDPNWPNLQYIRNLWEDTHKRFSIDENRVYLAGFSGGARMAWGIGFLLKGSVAGVIGCGAGTHPEYPLIKDLPFRFFGTAGNEDFNYDEVLLLGQKMSSLDIPHQIRSFSGHHQWPPEYIATEALDWMTLRAMKDGKMPRNSKWIDESYRGRIATIDELVKNGDACEANDLLKSAANDFLGFADTVELQKKLTGLAKASKDCSAAQEKQLKKYEEYNAKLSRLIHEFGNSDSSETTGKILQELNVSQLRKVGSGRSNEAFAARRLLESAFVQFAYYLPVAAMKQKNYRLALEALTVANGIKENDPNVHYNLAATYAQKGDKKKALEELRRSIERGFHDANLLETDPDLINLREEEEYKQIVRDLS